MLCSSKMEPPPLKRMRKVNLSHIWINLPEDVDPESLKYTIHGDNKEGTFICKPVRPPQEPIRKCLFCPETGNLKIILHHMGDHHSFTVPNLDYCTNVEGLLDHLGSKIEGEMMCLWCNEKQKDVNEVKHHMITNKHCKMRLHIDSSMNYGPFYNFDPPGTIEVAEPEVDVKNDDYEEDGDEEDDEAENDGKNGRKCEKCGMFIKGSSTKFNIHLEQGHDENNKFPCMKCDSKWKNAKALARHVGGTHSVKRSFKQEDKLCDFYGYNYETYLTPVRKFGNMYGISHGFTKCVDFVRVSMDRTKCSRRDLTLENGYTICHNETIGTGLTGDDKEEIGKVKMYGRRLLTIAKRASVISTDNCLDLPQHRKDEIREKFLNIPLISRFVRASPIWIDEN